MRLRNKIRTDTILGGRQEFNGATADVGFALQTEVGNSRWRPPNRVETGSTYISPSRTDINAVPTANPPLYGSINSMALLRILPLVLLWILSSVSGSRNFKMAAVTPVIYNEIHIWNAHSIYQLLWDLETKFQWIPMLVGHQEFKGATPDVVPCKRKWKIKMAAAKPGRN